MDTHIRLHVLQHVPFEDAANIGTWAEQKGCPITRTRLYENEPFPEHDSFDMLVIMGGLMNIYEYDTYPWLLRERQFIREAIERKKAVLGVCLGAQLIADVLGGKVKRNANKEIGWHQVQMTSKGKNCEFFNSFAKTFTAFHWHGDTFSIPPKAQRLAKSAACSNQAFLYGDRVLALQFHLEYSIESIEKMIRNCSDELVEAPYIQQPDEIRKGYYWVKSTEKMLFLLLGRLEQILHNEPVLK